MARYGQKTLEFIDQLTSLSHLLPSLIFFLHSNLWHRILHCFPLGCVLWPVGIHCSGWSLCGWQWILRVHMVVLAYTPYIDETWHQRGWGVLSQLFCVYAHLWYIFFFLLALKARVYMWAAAWMVSVPWLDDLFHVFLLPFALFPFLNYSVFSSESVEPAPHFHSSILLKPRTRRLPYLSTETQLKSTEIKKMPGVWRGWCFSQRCRFVLLMAALFGNHYKTRCNQWSCISILVVTAATPPLQHKHTWNSFITQSV